MVPSWMQVEKRQALVAVVLRDRNDQAQVGLDHLLLGVQIAAPDPLAASSDFLLRREQAHLAMSLRNSVSASVVPSGFEIERSLGAGALLGRALDHQARPSGWVDFLDQLDLTALEEAVQRLDVAFAETRARPSRSRSRRMSARRPAGRVRSDR